MYVKFCSETFDQNVDGKHTFFSNNFFMCGFHQCSFITFASISNPSYLSHRCFIIHGGSVGGFQSRPWNPAGNPGRKKVYNVFLFKKYAVHVSNFSYTCTFIFGKLRYNRKVNSMLDKTEHAFFE